VRPFTSVISLDDARRALQTAVVPIARTESISLADAPGRVAARDVASAIDVPPFARSAMDGYAVRSSDTATATRTAPVLLRIVERIYTGQMPATTLTPGDCAEIATGAPIPAGADAVVMVEETAPADGARVSILAKAAAGQNVTGRGADISRGTAIVRGGELLSASAVGALAAVGCTAVEVFAKPAVGILSTGNEVVEPGRPLGPGQIYDVNRFTLAAIASAHGGAPHPHAAVPDTLDALVEAIDDLRGADIIVFSGGSSVGEHDLILDLVAARGEMIFHGVGIKPGKPTAFARLAGRPFFGMPGNPTSCLSNAYVLLVPFLRATARLPPYSPRTVRLPLGRRIESASGRHTFYTVRIDGDKAFPAFRGSGAITSLSEADGYIEIPAEQRRIDEGTIVDVTLF
jgi:molybdenum cofactor synthesis domain-containing protein